MPPAEESNCSYTGRHLCKQASGWKLGRLSMGFESISLCRAEYRLRVCLAAAPPISVLVWEESREELCDRAIRFGAVTLLCRKTRRSIGKYCLGQTTARLPLVTGSSVCYPARKP
jgi:hypothetical protein